MQDSDYELFSLKHLGCDADCAILFNIKCPLYAGRILAISVSLFSIAQSWAVVQGPIDLSLVCDEAEIFSEPHLTERRVNLFSGCPVYSYSVRVMVDLFYFGLIYHAIRQDAGFSNNVKSKGCG